jgi:uncharacterized protein YbjQ (UPF0145 family)
MNSYNDILVTTTSALPTNQEITLMRPISAHLVAGTNLFSDIAAAFSDVFGGRSDTYQRQLTRLYTDAIEQLKDAARLIGANCIVGLKVDIDEVSGKGKSMFMITAVGTAAIVAGFEKGEKNMVVSAHQVAVSRQRKEYMALAAEHQLVLDDTSWHFIVSNGIAELSEYIMDQYRKAVVQFHDVVESAGLAKIRDWLTMYLDRLTRQERVDAIYGAIGAEANALVLDQLYQLLGERYLLDVDKILESVKGDTFTQQKRKLYTLYYDKDIYSDNDIKRLRELKDMISVHFTERGKRSSKKQLLSSKEKEVWDCECGKNNDIDTYCKGCDQDIYGFKKEELNPAGAMYLIDEKIDVVTECLEGR